MSNGLKQARLLFAHSSRPSLFLFHRGCCDCLVRSLHPPTHGTCCVVFCFLCVPCSSDISDISPDMASYCTYIIYTVPNMEPPFHLWFFIGSLESFDAWTFLLRCFPTSQVVFRPSLLSAVPTCFILFFPFCGLFLHNILISLTPDIPSTVTQQGAFSGFLYSIQLVFPTFQGPLHLHIACDTSHPLLTPLLAKSSSFSAAKLAKARKSLQVVSENKYQHSLMYLTIFVSTTGPAFVFLSLGLLWFCKWCFLSCKPAWSTLDPPCAWTCLPSELYV